MKKHFETFKGVNACNKNKKDNMTTDWEKVKCGRCKKNDEYKQARQLGKEENDHPLFRKALKDKIDMKLEVTKNELHKIQEICFSASVEWLASGSKYINFYEPLVCIDSSNSHQIYCMSTTQYPKEVNNKQFSFKDDCFVSDIKQKVSGIKIQGTGLYNGVYEKVELSACGRNINEFLKACNDDYSNAEIHVTLEDCNGLKAWFDIVDTDKKGLIKIFNNNFSILRIKEPSKVEIINKPPLGVAPLYIHNENRLNEIREAFTRYIEAKKDIPSEWVSEYLELINKIKEV